MEVAKAVRTVDIIVRGFLAFVTVTNDLVVWVVGVKSHDQSIVEDVEFAEEILVRIFFHVADDAAVKLEDFSETVI